MPDFIASSRLLKNKSASVAAAAQLFFISILIFAMPYCAVAHEGDFVISRDASTPPRLWVNGPSNLLSGEDCIPLMPGDGTLSGFWFNDAPGFSTLKEDGVIRERFHLKTGHRLALRLIKRSDDFCLVEPSTWNPVLTVDGDTYPFVTDAQGNFSIQMIPRAGHAGNFQVTMKFIDLAGLHADSAPFTLCFSVDPMLAMEQRVANAINVANVASIRLIAGAIELVTICRGASSSAVFERAPDGHIHGVTTPLTPPASYRQAVMELRTRLHGIDAWIASGKFHNVGSETLMIRKLAGFMPRLIDDGASGVPMANRTNLIRISKNVSGICAALAKSSDLSDAIGVRERYQELFSILESFEQFVPRSFVCPMRCEGERSYSGSGTCPICSMQLVDSRAHMDHRPKHGGIFFMAPDNLHHLEGTMEQGDFRVYFYDEFTKPIAAGFVTRCEIRGAGESEFHSFEIQPAPTREFLMARLKTATQFPVRIKLFVDFRDTAGPQVFDFEFASGSQ